MKMIRLWALRTSRLYLQEIFMVLISVRVWVHPRAVVWTEWLCKGKFQWHIRELNPRPSSFVAQCLDQLHLRVQEKQHQLFILHKLINQLSQLSEIFQCYPNRYDSYGKAMFNTASCLLVLTAYSRSDTGRGPSICVAVTPRVLTAKGYKINKRTWNVLNVELGHLYNEETFCDEGVNKVVIAHI